MENHVAHETTLKLCARYNQSIQYGDTEVLHPIVEEVKKFLDKIKAEDLPKFYDRIIDNCDYFPGRKQLRELYHNFNGRAYQKYEGITFEEVQEVYAEKNGIPRKAPDHLKDVTFSEMLKEERMIKQKFFNENGNGNNCKTIARRKSSREMMKKYGINKCGEFWRWCGANDINNE